MPATFPIRSEERFIHLQDFQLKLKFLRSLHADATDKPTLVFLHDSLGCIKLWRDFPEQLVLATGCKALIYDRRGYGESSSFRSSHREQDYLEREADVLEELLNELHIPKAVLFGHSDGGSIALLAAAKYRERIAGIITEGAHVFVEEITLQGICAAVQAYTSTNLPEKLQKYHGTKTDDVFHAWTDIWLSDRFRNWSIVNLLSGISCPSLIIQGEADEYGTLAQVDAIAAHTTGKAEKLIIPAIGHTPHREAPEVVLKSSVAFITQLL